MLKIRDKNEIFYRYKYCEIVFKIKYKIIILFIIIDIIRNKIE